MQSAGIQNWRIRGNTNISFARSSRSDRPKSEWMKGMHQAAHSDYIRNTILKQKATVFLQVSPFILLDVYKHSAGSRYFHLQSKAGNSRIVSNLGKRLPDYTVLYPTRHYSILWPMVGPQTSHATFWSATSKRQPLTEENVQSTQDQMLRRR
jgi:hypothetical protein